MKALHIFILAVLAAGTPLVQAYDSKRTVDYILATPAQFEGKEVTLDVMFVKPVQWKSPVAELAFFHAVTIDRIDKKPAGQILVAVPAAEASKFAKKYGTDFDGRNNSTSLKGVFMASPRKEGREKRAVLWIVDTTGKLSDLVKDQKITLDDAAGNNAVVPNGAGPRHRGRK